MLVMVWDTEVEAEMALAVLAGLAEVVFGPGGEGMPIVDLPGGGRGIVGRVGGTGAFDYDHPTFTRWAEPMQAADGRWFFKSLDAHPRFAGTDWRDAYSSAGGPDFVQMEAPAEWYDADGVLIPYAGA